MMNPITQTFGRGFPRFVPMLAVLPLTLTLAAPAQSADTTEQIAARAAMVRTIERHAKSAADALGRDFIDPAVLRVMGQLPRHAFVPDNMQDQAYDDRPLPIGYGQTISQPFIVALMTDLAALEPDDVVLEVGTGSGYQAAVLAGLTVRSTPSRSSRALAESAAERIDRLGLDNIETYVGDGYYGVEAAAPFDAIVVTAAATSVPPPLIQQLKPGGRMVIPVGTQLLAAASDDRREGRRRPGAHPPDPAGPLRAADPRLLSTMRLVAIALISAAILAYEVLLARLFSIIQWYHFAYMVISIALLGYGASGTLIALLRERLMPRAQAAFALFAALFGLSAIVCFALAQRLPFNPLEIVWDPTQLLLLLALYGLLTVPFFCGAACIGLAFACFDLPVGRIYRADLLGAGAGALGIVALLFAIMPDAALRAIGALALAAAALASLAEGRPGRLRALALAIAALALPALPQAWTALQLSPYKGLRQALQVPGAVIETERSSPLGLLSAVRSPAIPFRHVPGLSLNNLIEPPAQIGVFTDGDGLSPITAFDGDLAPLAYLDLTTSALPYRLLERPEVLILGAGGGADVLSAVWHSAARIDAVELNPQFADLVRDTYGAFAGRLYARPEVHVHIAEARGFVAGSERDYDLIALPLLDSFASGAGAASLQASFIYTVEAIGIYLDHLKPDGNLAITRWLKLPPRDSLKLLLTAIEALEARGVSEPARQLALIRGWDSTVLLVKNGTFSAHDIEQIRAFTQERSFDPVHYPRIAEREVNQFNVLQQPYFYEGAKALLGPERERFVADYKFDLRPATDDRPYFFDFFTWRALPEIASLAAQSGPALLDWGYLILFATLVQAVLVSALLVLVPLWLWSPTRLSVTERWRVGLYFVLIGFAFLFVEIASIQRFTLFLSHPLYAIAVVLAGFLVFAGLGSGLAARLEHRLKTRGGPSALVLAIGAIAILSIAYVFGLPALFEQLMALPDAARIVLSLVLIAPLALFMGMPFPLVLARLKAQAPDFVPWAWGINGCASVASAILATLLTMALGARAVVLIAALLYLLAAAILSRAPAAAA